MTYKFPSKVASQHGYPTALQMAVTPNFVVTSDELMSLLDTTLTFSIALYPQTNGITEVTNYTMEELLYIHACLKSWVQKLLLVAMLINATPSVMYYAISLQNST